MAAAKACSASSSSQRKRSRRIIAATQFLSNISLDGNVSTKSHLQSRRGSVSEENRNIDSQTGTINKQVVCTKPASVKEKPESSLETPAKAPRPNLEHSFSESQATKETSEDRRERNLLELLGETCDVDRSTLSRSFSSSESSRQTYTIHSTTSYTHTQHSTHKVTLHSKASFRNRRLLNDKRIVLCTSHNVPFMILSVMRYIKNDLHLPEGLVIKKRPDSVCVAIEGVEIGTDTVTVSYSNFLVPSYPLTFNESSYDGILSLSSTLTDIASISTATETITGTEFEDAEPVSEYDPLMLDDPELTAGKNKTVLQWTSYVVSIVDYTKPSQLKKDLNEQFREKFPNIEITLTKMRSLKRDLIKIESSLAVPDISTVAYAFVYFEKMILKEKINKLNRKLVAGSCLLLATKFNDDLKKKQDLKSLIEEIEDKLKIHVKELLTFEFQVLVALEFNLHVQKHEVLPHYKRIETEWPL